MYVKNLLVAYPPGQDSKQHTEAYLSVVLADGRFEQVLLKPSMTAEELAMQLQSLSLALINLKK